MEEEGQHLQYHFCEPDVKPDHRHQVHIFMNIYIFDQDDSNALSRVVATGDDKSIILQLSSFLYSLSTAKRNCIE